MSETNTGLRNTPHLAECIVRTVREPLVVLDGELKVVFASDAFCRVFKVSREETLGRHMYELGSGEWSEDGLRHLLEEVIPNNTAFEDYLVDYDFPRIGRRVMKLTGRRIEQGDGGEELILLVIEDITGRRRMEKRLEESNRMVENSPDIMARFDLHKRYLFVNRSFEEHAGMPREKIIGRTPEELRLPAEGIQSFTAVLDRVIKTGRRTTVEIPFGEMNYQFSVVPETDEQGSLVSITSFARDITGLKKAVNALKESEETFRSLSQNLPDVIARYGCDFRYRYINPAGERLFGKPRDEIIGRTNADLGLPEKLVAFLHGNFKTVCETKKGMTMEFNVPFPGGERCISSHMAPEFDAQGNIASLLSINRDITPLKETEQSLRESEERFRTLFEASPDAITFTDMQGKILYTNKKTAEVHGSADVREIIGKSAFSLIDPADRARAMENLKRTIETGLTENLEYRLLRKDGSGFPAELNAKAIRDAKGNTIGFIGITRDITEQKRIREELERREEEFRMLAENSPDIIVRYDKDARFLYINPKAAATFHHPLSEIIGKQGSELGIPEKDVEFWKTNIAEVFASRKEKQIEFSVLIGGEKTYFSATLVPELRKEGGMFSVLAIGRDITREKEAERKLTDALAIARKRARETAEGQRVLTALMDNIAEGLLITDAEGKIRFLSRYLAQVTGVPVEEALGKDVSIIDEKLGIPEKPVLARSEYPISLALKKGKVTIAEERSVRLPDGSVMTVLINAQPVYDAEGAIAGALASWRDITERKVTENALRRNEYELRTLVDNSPDIIIRFDRHLRYAYANPAFERITGISREDLAGKTNGELGMPKERRDVWEGAARNVFGSGRDGTVDFDMTSFFGKRYFSGRVIPEFAKDGSVETVMIIARDITERRQYEEKIRFISFHDAVTGLYNRAYYEEELRRIDTERELPISIIMGDVNNLKLSNDVLGHQEGDRLLKTIAAAIQRACRKNDIVARWGGDEFAVLLPKTDLTTAEGIRSRIQQIAGESPGTVVRPSIALGVAAKDRRDRNINLVVRRAEEMMYANKTAESKKNEENVISSLLNRAKERSWDTGEHVERCCDLARRFGKALGLSEEQEKDLELLIRLHDIGMAVVPREIVTKPGRLTRDEWKLVQKHSEAGFEAVRSFPDMARISDEVLSHDERWDGSGYPRGLADGKIPYLARVFSLIEAYDVMTHPRPYARTLTPGEAIEELQRNAGSQFDPGLVKIFVEVVSPAKVPA